MTKSELEEKTKALLGDSPERAIIAECIYKGEAFRSFSITISDSKEDGFDIPYAPYTELDKNEDLIALLERRKGPEYSEKVRSLLVLIAEILEEEGLEFTKDDIESLVRLDKPVIMVSRRK